MWAQLGPTRSCAVVHFFEVSLTAVYIDAGIHTDVEVHSDICLTGSLTAVLGTRPRAEPSGTRFDGSVHDGDQSIEKMPTSKKVTYVGCHKTRPSHGCDLSHSRCLLVDLEVGAGSRHGMGREERHTKKFVMR